MPGTKKLRWGLKLGDGHYFGAKVQRDNSHKGFLVMIHKPCAKEVKRYKVFATLTRSESYEPKLTTTLRRQRRPPRPHPIINTGSRSFAADYEPTVHWC